MSAALGHFRTFSTDSFVFSAGNPRCPAAISILGHAKKVWENFEIRDLGDYHDLYLSTDVMLLADVFENFRDTCISIYELDPAHFYTSPGMAWQAALKVTGVQLELLTDREMLMFFEKSL